LPQGSPNRGKIEKAFYADAAKLRPIFYAKRPCDFQRSTGRRIDAIEIMLRTMGPELFGRTIGKSDGRSGKIVLRPTWYHLLLIDGAMPGRSDAK
jgi:hypothetical protein